jgi:hypothetical protein
MILDSVMADRAQVTRLFAARGNPACVWGLDRTLRPNDGNDSALAEFNYK